MTALIVDLGSLNEAVNDWLWRAGDTQLVARNDDLVGLFEAEFIEDPENRFLEMQELATTVIAEPYVPLPPDFIEMERLQVLGDLANPGDPNQILDYVTPRRAAVLDNSTPSQVVRCQNYTVMAGNIVFTPQSKAPIGAKLELLYYQFPRLQSAPGSTNWLIQKYPNLYLYGALTQASAYIDDKNFVAQWDSAYQRAVKNLQKSERKKKTTSGPLQMGASMEMRTNRSR